MLSENSFQAVAIVPREKIRTSKHQQKIHYQHVRMLSESSFLTVLIATRESMPSSIKIWAKFSNVTFWNGLNYKSKSYKLLLFIIYIEVGIDYPLPQRFSSSWRGAGFSWNSQDFPESEWTKLLQNLEIKNNLRTRLDKRPFSSTIYIPNK